MSWSSSEGSWSPCQAGHLPTGHPTLWEVSWLPGLENRPPSGFITLHRDWLHIKSVPDLQSLLFPWLSSWWKTLALSDPRTSSITSPGDVLKVQSLVPPQTYWIRTSEGWEPSIHILTSPWWWNTLKCENHCLGFPLIPVGLHPAQGARQVLLSIYTISSLLIPIKKAEHRRIDAFELWCWRRLLRVPWTAGRSNQSILKEIKSEYSLEGWMLKKLQYFDHLMWRADSLEKTLMLGKIEGRRRRGMTEDEMVG